MLTPPEVTRYWNYAELINEELGKTAQYVEPDKENYNTYSLAYTKIILSACSEIEVVCKLLCQQIDPQKDYVSSEILNKSGNKLVKTWLIWRNYQLCCYRDSLTFIKLSQKYAKNKT